ncbi:MAG: hypothetical protein ACJ789_09685 [Thermomicrobiales bacterium]
MSQHTTDLLIFFAVVAARFFVPLGIPRYPLPFEIAAMLLDAADQTIFQAFTHLDLAGYQGYDKALDVYYLTIVYLATMRNWTHIFAFEVNRFLYFYRLVGVVLFEATHVRAVLLIFPNTFEYFFIFYETVRLRWNPKRMSKRLVIGATAFIWIVIKLPQEYWIHVAQVDTTDVIKEDIFGVPTDTGWGEIIGDYPFVFIGLAILIVAIVWGAKWILDHKLPPAEWKFSFDADAHDREVTEDQISEIVSAQARRLFDRELVEKIIMFSMIIYIFSKIIPNLETTNLGLALGVAVFVIFNAVLSGWLIRRGIPHRSITRQFCATAAVNGGIIVGIDLLLRYTSGGIHLGTGLFFALLLTLLIVLYDRYRPVYLARAANAGQASSAWT